MSKNKLILIGLGQALAVFIYILLVVEVMTTLGRLFPNKPDQFWQPVAMLLLLVISAAITGFLVFGKSATLYLDGLKKEAIKLFGYTIGWLGLIAVIVFVILILQT